ncbi:MAG: hypothetical protein Q8K60_07370 [Parachlamydiaceae bacterium]|nr:hypothetical protein [Parachlamydiaceae bacterium]
MNDVKQIVFNLKDPNFDCFSEVDSINRIRFNKKNENEIIITKNRLVNKVKILMDEKQKELLGNFFNESLKYLALNYSKKIIVNEKKFLINQFDNQLGFFKKICKKIFVTDLISSYNVDEEIKRISSVFFILITLNEFKLIKSKDDYNKKIQIRNINVNENLSSIKTGKLPDDFINNLKINSTEDLLTPLSYFEQAFIENYFKNSPDLVKQKAHYELLFRNTNQFINNLKYIQNNEILLHNQVFNYYDIDNQNYKFLGCASNLVNIFDEYKGYLIGKWPYLCTSIIDESHTFFFEGNRRVFQVLEVPYESIVHTSPEDLHTPDSTVPMQANWYSMAQKGKILSAYIFDLYNRFNEKILFNEIKSNTIIDRIGRLNHECDKWIDQFSQQETFFKQLGYLDKILKLITLLENSNDRKNIDEIFITLNNVKEVFLDKDYFALEELILSLHYIEKFYPDCRDEDITSENFNRLSHILDVMIKYYSLNNFNKLKEKEEFFKLFLINKETNIISELNKLKNVIEYFKNINASDSTYHPYLNRLMGPQEILSGTNLEDNNEINIDTYTKKPLKVKAWLLSKSLISMNSEKDRDFLSKIFTIARHEQIPVLFRTSLPDDFMKQKLESKRK